MPKQESVEKQLAELSERLHQLQGSLYELAERVRRLEGVVSAEKKVEVVAAPPTAAIPPKVPPPPVPPVRPPAVPTPPRVPSAVEVEVTIARNWLNWIGVIAIIIGLGFFLKYAFESQWIGTLGRVMLGLLCGLLFLAGGEYFQWRGLAGYAQGLTGGGIAILYLSIYAAYNFYHFLGPFPAFAFMVLVTATAVGLSVRQDAVSIMVLATLGGFLTPVLIGIGRPAIPSIRLLVYLFSYITLLDLGILAIAYLKQWRVINLFAFVATVWTIIGWLMALYEPEQLWAAFGVLTLFFLIFLAVACIYNLVRRQLCGAQDLFLIIANPAIYYGISFWLLAARYREFMGLFAILLTIVYVLLGRLAFARHPEDRLLVFSLFGIGATFLTIAIPIQLRGHWITIGWTVEALILLAIGLEVPSLATRVAGLIILLVAVLRLLFFPPSVPLEQFMLIFNNRFFVFAVGIAAVFTAAHLYVRYSKVVTEGEKKLVNFLTIVGSILILWLLTAEVNSYFDAKSMPPVYPYAMPVSGKQFAISAVWAAYSFVMIIIGILRRYQLLRLFAIIMFFITILKVFLFDTAALRTGYRILSFICLGIILLVVSYLYHRFGERIREFALGEKSPQQN